MFLKCSEHSIIQRFGLIRKIPRQRKQPALDLMTKPKTYLDRHSMKETKPETLERPHLN